MYLSSNCYHGQVDCSFDNHNKRFSSEGRNLFARCRIRLKKTIFSKKKYFSPSFSHFPRSLKMAFCHIHRKNFHQNVEFFWHNVRKRQNNTINPKKVFSSKKKSGNVTLKLRKFKKSYHFSNKIRKGHWDT